MERLPAGSNCPAIQVLRAVTGEPDAAARQLGRSASGHCLDLRCDLGNRFKETGIRIKMRWGGVEPIDIGKKHEQISTGHGGNTGRQTVIVAIADFGGSDGIVLIDDRHGAHLQELADRRAGVEVTAPLFGITERQKDLSGNDLVRRQAFGPGAGQRDLANGRRCLAFLQLQRAGREIEHRTAERNGA
jgi:hypothetical protein